MRDTETPPTPEVDMSPRAKFLASNTFKTTSGRSFSRKSRVTRSSSEDGQRELTPGVSTTRHLDPASQVTPRGDVDGGPRIV
jgi:hypothetical protein